MDFIAHGLWGGAPFYAQGRKKFLAGVLVGMAPDLLSFGVFHVIHPEWLALRLVEKIFALFCNPIIRHRDICLSQGY
jgi:hypothetical protein